MFTHKPSRANPILLLLLTLVLLTACAPVPATPFPTRTPTASPVPSAAVQWFPPTNTPHILPTDVPVPTPDIRASLGPILLEDDFTDPGPWGLATTETRSAAIANGHLTLTVSGGKGTLTALRISPLFTDFYLEVTASANLCSGLDEYGLMLRITENLDHFRFGLSCDGQAHADRIYQLAASAFAPWQKFGVIPAVAPGSVRLGVWAEGGEIDFYANDRYLFSVRDTIFYQGTLGFYARANGNSPISVNFSDLVVYRLP